MEIHQFLLTELQALKEEEYKKGYNQCLKDQGLTGERHQNLYL